MTMNIFIIIFVVLIIVITLNEHDADFDMLLCQQPPFPKHVHYKAN